MANKNPCELCTHYYALIKYHRKSGDPRELDRGYCLDQTVFAKNRAGNPVYPPHAKVADLPYARHHTVIRGKKDVVAHCMAFKAKRR